MKILLLVLTTLAMPASATSWYVDSSSVGLNNGTSWANAWTNMDLILGLSPGDTVYISGGPTGSSQTYRINSLGTNGPGIWIPKNGTVGQPITYKIGQDSSHNGTAVFYGYGAYAIGGNYWLGYQVTPRPNNLVISGDAGDGRMHFALTNYGAVGVGFQYTNVRISYVDCGTIQGGMDFSPGKGIEFDHNYLFITSPTLDHVSGATFSGTNWGDSSIHHCTIYIPGVIALGLGADVLQWQGSGFDIYNNNFIGYNTNYAGGQHMDGWQGQGGFYIRIYNNFIANISDYALFGDLTSSGFTNLWIWNNVIQNCSGGVIIGVDAAAVAVRNFDTVVIANNLVDGGTNRLCQNFGFNNIRTNETHFTNCRVENNIAIGGEGFDFRGNPITPTTNFVMTSAQATNSFAFYNASLTNSNFRLVAGDSSLISAGVNLSAYFTTDMAGTNRPAVGSWDIGPYGFLGKPRAPTQLRVQPP